MFFEFLRNLDINVIFLVSGYLQRQFSVYQIEIDEAISFLVRFTHKKSIHNPALLKFFLEFGDSLRSVIASFSQLVYSLLLDVDDVFRSLEISF